LARRPGLPHVAHDRADNRGHDCTRHPSANKLANNRGDVDVARRALEHQNERGQQRTTGHAAKGASDRIAGWCHSARGLNADRRDKTLK
jgi:hypothetical protein